MSNNVRPRPVVIPDDWIGYRHSLAEIDRRAARGDQARVCDECGCEVDVVPACHSPRCKR